MASAIHGVAFLIEEMEENMTNETVRDIINSQLTELMLDIRSVKEKIDDHLPETGSKRGNLSKTIHD